LVERADPRRGQTGLRRDGLGKEARKGAGWSEGNG
jgi:hypothetical protein